MKAGKRSMKSRKAQVATGMFIFISTIFIVFVFFAFNLLISMKSLSVSQDINDKSSIFKADQTLIAFTRIPGIEAIIYKKEAGCAELKDFAKRYIEPIYSNEYGWRLTLKENDNVLCDTSKNEPAWYSSSDSLIYSEQLYPLPLGKEQAVLKLRLDEYKK